MNKRIVCGIMALCMVAGLTACGNSEESESVKESSSGVSVADNSESSAEEISQEEPTTEEATEPEPTTEDRSELFAYYDDLSAEYEKYGEKGCQEVTKSSSNFFIADGKVIGCFDNIENGYDKVFSYDVKSKELKTFDKIDYSFKNCYYADNFIYTYESWSEGYIKKYDLDGNMVQDATIDSFDKLSYVGEDGTTFFDNIDSWSVVSPDFKTTTELEFPTYEAEHGVSEPVKSFNIFGEDENGYYACAYHDGGTRTYLYALDKKTMKWSGGTNEIPFNGSGYKLVGKYILCGSELYDMEKEEVIAKVNAGGYSAFANFENYRGGDSFIILNEEKESAGWYKAQLASDGSSVDWDSAEALGTETKGSVYKLDNTYYVVKDDYGIFLRTYEKGETEEETIVLFEND